MGKKMRSLVTLVCFDEEGMEVDRFEGITEDEAWKKSRDYARVSVVEKKRGHLKVKCGVPRCGKSAAYTHGNVVRIRLERDGPAIPVCKYHAAGVTLAFKGVPVKGKLKYEGVVIAPSALCVGYCPSYWKGECRAYARPSPGKEKKKREKGYNVCGEYLTVLCIEDDWWALLAGVGGEELREEL